MPLRADITYEFLATQPSDPSKLRAETFAEIIYRRIGDGWERQVRVRILEHDITQGIIDARIVHRRASECVKLRIALREWEMRVIPE